MSISPVLWPLVLFAVPTVTVSTRVPRSRARAPRSTSRRTCAWPVTSSNSALRRPRPRKSGCRPPRHTIAAAGARPFRRRVRYRSPSSVDHRRAKRRCVVAVRRRVRQRRCPTSPTGPTPNAGDVVLTLAAGAALSRYLGQTVGQTEFLRWNIEAAQRLLWLERYVASRTGRQRGRSARRDLAGHRVRARVVQVPRHRRAGARRRQPHAARRFGRRDRRRERRRQVDAHEVAVPPVRPDRGPHHRRRRRPRHDRSRFVETSASAARSKTSSASSSSPRAASASATCPGIDERPAVETAVDRGGASRRDREAAPKASRRSSARRGTTAGPQSSVSGRSWPWPAGSCATARCCACSTSRPPRSTPKPNTLCSNDSPSRLTGRRRRRAHHRAGVAPVLDRAHGRPDRGARRVPRRRVRRSRNADSQRRPVLRAVRHPSRRLPLAGVPQVTLSDQARPVTLCWSTGERMGRIR